MDVLDRIIAKKLYGGGSGGSGGGGGTGGGGSDAEWIGDGNTHIWVSLTEGRTSPMVGVGVNGSVTVDWGDSSAPDVLNGTNINNTAWTPTHNYANPGDYVITLTVDGELCVGGYDVTTGGSYLLRYNSGSDGRNFAYNASIKKIEFGNNVILTGDPLAWLIGLEMVENLPVSATAYLDRVFQSCYSLQSVVIPNGTTKLTPYEFVNCKTLQSVVIPESVTELGNSLFNGCESLHEVIIPSGVSELTSSVFYNCFSLISVKMLGNIKSVGVACFYCCYALAVCDFTNCTQVPTLAATSAFNQVPTDCEIRVPAALVDEWKAATNWSTYADNIVGV